MAQRLNTALAVVLVVLKNKKYEDKNCLNTALAVVLVVRLIIRALKKQ